MVKSENEPDKFWRLNLCVQMRFWMLVASSLGRRLLFGSTPGVVKVIWVSILERKLKAVSWGRTLLASVTRSRLEMAGVAKTQAGGFLPPLRWTFVTLTCFAASLEGAASAFFLVQAILRRRRGVWSKGGIVAVTVNVRTRIAIWIPDPGIITCRWIVFSDGRMACAVVHRCFSLAAVGKKNTKPS